MTRLTVTLCGSLTRARHDLARVHRALALAGHLVHAPVPPMPGEPEPTAEQLDQLTDRHYEAIDQSDLVIGVAPDGEVGWATGAEMRYAAAYGVRTRWAMSLAAVDELIVDIDAGRLDRTAIPA